MPESGQIVIKTNERIANVGKTNSGKTYLAEHITAPMPRLVALDGKNVLGKPGWNLDSSEQAMRALRRGQNARVRIVETEQQDWDYWLDLVWEMGNTFVYIDEMLALTAGNGTASKSLKRLYQMGREKRIGVMASTQRPKSVPAVMFSEAEWLFVFRVSRKDDRKYLTEFGDEYETMMEPIRDEHGFYVYNQTWRRPRYLPKFVPSQTSVVVPRSQAS